MKSIDQSVNLDLSKKTNDSLFLKQQVHNTNEESSFLLFQICLIKKNTISHSFGNVLGSTGY